MAQIIGLVLVIALVYAVKAVAVMRSHDDIAEKFTSFSWMSVRAEDKATVESWAVEEEAKASETAVSLGGLRPAGV